MISQQASSLFIQLMTIKGSNFRTEKSFPYNENVYPGIISAM